MVKAQSSASAALSQAGRISQEGLEQLQSDFTRAREAFQDQLMSDLERSSAKTQSYIEKLSNGLASTLDVVLSKVRITTSAIESQMGNLSDVSLSPKLPI